MASVAIHARVSSARQKKDQTIASQTAALRAHAAKLHLELVGCGNSDSHREQAFRTIRRCSSCSG
jgi:DNA invertase Pin-like site-specific DNA recombinase